MKLISILVLAWIGGTALGDHAGTTTDIKGGQKSVEQAKASLSDVARQVQRAGIKRVYEGFAPTEKVTVDQYEKREKILRGILKLAKSQDLEDLRRGSV